MPGKYFEDLEPGQRTRHALGRTVTEMDNVLFSALTMNTQPLHINEDFAAQTQFGQRIVNGIFTLGLVVGLTVSELTEGTIVANLGYEKVTHPNPVFHGDTIYVETEVLEKREFVFASGLWHRAVEALGQKTGWHGGNRGRAQRSISKAAQGEIGDRPGQQPSHSHSIITPMRARRALLYMPGDDQHKIRKATTLDVDCVCMDMEDGVALNRKPEARSTIAEALQTLDFGRAERLARINAIGSGFEAEDLATVLPARPDGIVIPKMESAEQIRRVSQIIADHETQKGWPAGGIGLLVGVETARGIVNLAQIAAADPRLQAIIFGAEDFAGDIGATRTAEAWEVFYARSAVVTHAAAYDLQAIDMVYIDFNDLDGLKREALEGARMAFSGKQVIHPNQVAPVQQAYTPSDAAIAYARRVVQAFEENQQAGKGAFALDGKMIDAPILKAAERVLALARAAGIL